MAITNYKDIEFVGDVGDFHEFSYFYLQAPSTVKMVQNCSYLPEDEDLEYCTLYDAITFVQRLGCQGRSQHIIDTEYHRLCLAVLRWAVQNTGQVIPILYRGVRSQRPDKEHKILFGSLDKNVAAFYGDIREYHNVKGIVFNSRVKSVITDDWTETDIEVIFFPDL